MSIIPLIFAALSSDRKTVRIAVIGARLGPWSSKLAPIAKSAGELPAAPAQLFNNSEVRSSLHGGCAAVVQR
jgi:hypothetical protein